MTQFDCDEYWLRTIWDRTRELTLAAQPVRAEWLRQEQFLLSSLSKVICHQTGILIADLGCGPGHLAERVLDTFGDRISLKLIDFNVAALAEARRRIGSYGNVEFYLGRVDTIGHDFPGAFNVVYCLDILHHLPQLPSALQSIRDSLAPGGVFLANAFAAECYPQRDRLKYGYLRSAARRLSAALANNAYPWLWSSAQRWIRRRGFGRIAPLCEQELRLVLGAKFDVQIQRVGYYYFVRATVPRDA
jgi:ubiquinone/menaquinone biosynthesis C-methylase UbiE